MSREIKFRAWDKERKEMVYVLEMRFLFEKLNGIMVSGYDNEVIDHEIFPEALVLMQFASLLDKNGKEIYEGDIVLTQEYTDKPLSRRKKHKRHIGVVVYFIGQGDGFYSESSKKFDRHDEYEARWDVKIADKGIFTCSNWGPFYDCEVIGNIYEQPELIP